MRYDSFQDALRNGQFDFVERRDAAASLPDETRELIAGLGLLYDGRTAAALAHFQAMATDAMDANVRGLSGRFAAQLLYERRDYRQLAAIVGEPADAGGKLVHILANLPELALESAESVGSELRPGPRGHPFVQVTADGTDDFWVLDTGASQSVVAASVAAELGIEPVGEPVDVTTATTIVRPARVGLLKELRLGQVLARNVPVLIYDDADLTFELPESETPILLRGVIGWPVIRELRAQLDFPARQYTAYLSEPRDYGERNFSWMGYPFVRVAAPDGQPLLFGLDTGSSNTSIGDNLFRKLTFDEVRQDTARIGGVGGFETVDVRIVDRLQLAIAGTLATLGEVRTEEESGVNDLVFFAGDGVLGSDLAQNGTMLLDFPNAHFGIRPAT
ncbi:MAG: aspartyl protease family protein [Planctomycetota bacterium]